MERYTKIFENEIDIEINPNRKNLEAFMDELNSKSSGHFPNIGFFLPNDVVIDASIFDNAIDFNIMSMKGGKGYGSKALKMLTKLADKHQVVLQGIVKPFGTDEVKKLDVSQLMKWYKSFGFRKRKKYNADGRRIERLPK